MPNRYLIYTISFGKAFREFVAMAVSSIVQIGKWQQDIVILTDYDDPPPGCERAVTINIFGDLKARYPWLGDSVTRNMVSKLKTEISDYVQLSHYEYVLYLDADVLVNTDKLSDKVYALAQESAFVVMQDCTYVSSGFSFNGGQVLTLREQARWGYYGINAGIVGFPTNPFGRRILAEWRQMNRSDHFKYNDQGNLIAVLLRKHYGQWGFIGDSAFGVELRRYAQTFVHFTSQQTTLMYRYYTHVLGLTLQTVRE